MNRWTGSEGGTPRTVAGVARPGAAGWPWRKARAERGWAVGPRLRLWLLCAALAPAVALQAHAAAPQPQAAAAAAAPPAVRAAAAATGPAAVPATGPATGPASVAPGPISVPDTLGQRLLACTGCHGEQGRATAQGYFPRIAGKPAEYLYRQLRHFREGRRHNATMAALLQPLSDDYLREIAEHFSRQHPPYPPPPPATATPQGLARGRQLALEGDAARELPACVRCHGEQLAGVAPALPALLGLPRDYLVVQLGAWRTGLRQAHAPDCMATIARRLSGDDVAAVAAWLAAQPVPEGARPAPHPNTPLPLTCGSAAP